jgi:DNA uptake protein ComE-like DNA-binding protein
MRKIWISIVATAALLAGVFPAAAQAADPATTAVPAEPPSPGKNPPKKMSSQPKQKLVNLNAATAKELKALPGGSDEEAARIIAGRPYNSKADLVTRHVITDGRYYEIKSLVVAGVPAKGAAPAKATAPAK